jgi:hypothetical protein
MTWITRIERWVICLNTCISSDYLWWWAFQCWRGTLCTSWLWLSSAPSGSAIVSSPLSVVAARCLLFGRYNLPSDITSYDRGATLFLQTPFLQVLFGLSGSGRIRTRCIPWFQLWQRFTIPVIEGSLLSSIVCYLFLHNTWNFRFQQICQSWQECSSSPSHQPLNRGWVKAFSGRISPG